VNLDEIATQIREIELLLVDTQEQLNRATRSITNILQGGKMGEMEEELLNIIDDSTEQYRKEQK